MAQPLYRIHVVAEMVGISEALLRAWERRYQLLTPRRSPSGYRAYTAADVELLRRVTRLTREGMSIGDVVNLLPDLKREVKALGETPEPAPPAEAGPRLLAWRQRALAAAAQDDQLAVEQVLDEALATLPPLQVLDELLIPLQREVGDAWHAGTLTTAQEHLVSHSVRGRLLSLLHAAPKQARRHVVCACFPEEDHDLGLLGAALRFRHAGFRVTYLGARTPAPQLGSTVKRLAPDVVALSSVTAVPAAQYKKTLMQVIDALPKGPRVLVGGHGAEQHPEIAEKLGAWLTGPETWAKVLS